MKIRRVICCVLHGKKSSTCCNVVKNRIEQCCAAHIVQGCQQWLTTLLHAIQSQQYCSMLLTTVNNVGSTTLFNPVELQAHDFLPCSCVYLKVKAAKIPPNSLVTVFCSIYVLKIRSTPNSRWSSPLWPTFLFYTTNI